MTEVPARRFFAAQGPSARDDRDSERLYSPAVATLLITGGAGFIGSCCVRQILAETDDRVVVLDKLTYAGSLLNLAPVEDHPGYTFVHGDIADPATVERVFAEHAPDAVLNFAAESHVDRSIEDPGAFIQTNIVGTYELLEAARRHGAERGDGFRFLHVSTDEVFGSLGDSGLFSETTRYKPNSPYSASKASADHLVRAYGKTYGLPVLMTNCSNNYGPHQFPEKLIPLMILNAVDGRDLPIYGDGSNVRDWIYVEDHCRGIRLVLEKGRPGESYNLGGRTERTNLEIVDRICELVGRARPAAESAALAARGLSAYEDLKTFVTDRPGHDQRYAIDDSKAGRELGWAPSMTLEEGLAATVEWYLGNRDWCEAVSGGYGRERLGLDSDGDDPDPAKEDA